MSDYQTPKKCEYDNACAIGNYQCKNYSKCANYQNRANQLYEDVKGDFY